MKNPFKRDKKPKPVDPKQAEIDAAIAAGDFRKAHILKHGPLA